MDRLQAMEIFTKVVELNSFSRAAEAMDIPPASVTTIIQKLEARLHVRLMNRTTRKLKLTPEGEAYYQTCVRVLAAIEEGEHAVVGSGIRPRGKLRIDMPASLGKLIVVPQIASFRSSYPDIDLMIGFSDKDVDLVEEGVDCAIRVGPLQDSTLVAKKLGSVEIVTAASPAYINRHGMPKSLSELNEHAAVHYFSSRSGRMLDLSFLSNGEVVDIRTRSSLSFNDAEAYVLAGVGGAGIIQAPLHIAHAYLTDGSLIEVLPDMKPGAKNISAVFPQSKHLAPKVRVFVEWALGLFGQCPILGGTKGTANQISTSVVQPGGRPVNSVASQTRGLEVAF